MAIKNRKDNQYYQIEYILTEDNNPSNWDRFDIEEDEIVIGYLFLNRDKRKLASEVMTLTIFVINKRYYIEGEVTLKELKDKWEIIKINKDKSFKNPPLENWLDTKQNWCNQTARKLSLKYNMLFEETLSDLYYVITILYNKTYMNSLNYIYRAAENEILMRLRYNKRRQNVNNTVSLDSILLIDENDALSLSDIIGEDDPEMIRLEQQELVDKALSILSESFSQREIKMLLSYKSVELPQPLYKRFRRWTQKHSMREL